MLSLVPPLRSLTLLKRVHHQTNVSRNNLLHRIRGTTLTGKNLLHHQLVTALIIQRLTGNSEGRLRITALDAVSRNILLQRLLTRQIARSIRSLQREAVMALGELRQIHGTHLQRILLPIGAHLW